MIKILWFYNRLKAMSLAEVLYRIKNICKHYINNIRYKNDINIYDITNININFEKIYKNLDCIFEKLNLNNIKISNEYYVFNEKIDMNNKIQWHKGIKGLWEKSINSYDIEFKDSDSIGDIRYTWELNRHQFLPYLAACYLKTNDYKYIKLLEYHFDDWIDNNKFLKGVNWSSSMEIAIRAYQWLTVLHLIRDVENEDLKDKISKSVIISINYVMNNLSLYSSANNHLILEVAISSIVGYCFQGVYNQNWLNKGYNVLEKELKNQFYEDGVNKEQALHYQAFVTDMMLQYNTIMKKIGYEPLEENLIKKSVEFIHILNAKECYVDFGDSDDAKILTLNTFKYNYYDYILNFASLYYGIEFNCSDNKYSEITLFCNENAKLREYDYKNSYIYTKGGYSIIKNKENILFFDYALLGFGDLAAHGHADALMFMYYYKGKEFFIDSGTYIYNIKKEKRDYYRSTKAHSTLCYQGINQSEIKGPFLWGKKASSKLIKSEENNERYIIEAENDGYRPNIHKRRIEYDKNSDFIKIYDFFDKKAEINFILDNKVSIERINKDIYKLNNIYELYLYADGNVEIEKINISKRFLEEHESYKINIKYNFKSEHLTLICSDIDILKSEIRERKKLLENS